MDVILVAGVSLLALAIMVAVQMIRAQAVTKSALTPATSTSASSEHFARQEAAGRVSLGPAEFLAAAPALLQARTYFVRFNASDMHARGCTSPADCLRAYTNAVRVITADERLRLAAWASEAERLVNRSEHASGFAALFRGLRWRFCKLDGSAEGGFPHTHGDVIFLPQAFLGTGNDARKKAETLVHELVHVAQRKRPDLCRELYTRFWNLRAVARVAGPVQGVGGGDTRSNPDLDGSLYVSRAAWGARSVGCVQVFKTARPASLAESRPLAVHVLHGGGSTAMHTAPDAEMQCAYEHPNEAMAYILAAIAAGSPPSRVDSPSFPVQPVREWLQWLSHA